MREARHELARHLAACGFGRIDDAVLVLSEFAAYAALHSASKGQFFIVRSEIFAAYLWLEVEDLGGDWDLRPPDESRPHGLQLVELLAGPDGWGVDGGSLGRVVWARLETGQ